MDRYYDRQVINFEKWLHPKRFRLGLVLLLILAACFGSGWLVYATGGIKFVYSHTMYIPILMAAFFFRVPGGMLAGILGGLILGPFMPIDVATGEMQVMTNWMYRLGMFSLIGTIAGYIIKTLDIQIGKLGWLSSHHPDSGLPNRYSLLGDFDNMISDKGLDQNIAVLVSRINNYDALAVIYGIEVTDLLIGKVFQRLQTRYAEISICQILPSMLGFLVPSPNGSYKERAQNLLDTLREPVIHKNVPVFIDASSGLACFPLHGNDPGLVLRKAMMATNSSQASGEDLVEYDLSSEDLGQETTSIIGWLSIALENNQFLLQYQPIIDLSTGSVIGVEALIRWQHPEKGLIPPAEFIPHLENTSLIFPVQNWVINKAWEQRQIWSEKGFLVDMAINISSRGVNNPDWINSLSSPGRTKPTRQMSYPAGNH